MLFKKQNLVQIFPRVVSTTKYNVQSWEKSWPKAPWFGKSSSNWVYWLLPNLIFFYLVPGTRTEQRLRHTTDCYNIINTRRSTLILTPECFLQSEFELQYIFFLQVCNWLEKCSQATYQFIRVKDDVPQVQIDGLFINRVNPVSLLFVFF